MVDYTKLINTEIQFTDQSTNTPMNWLWNFGDGTTSTLQNPKKTYTTKGTYTIKLTTSNTCGNCFPMFKTIEITETPKEKEYLKYIFGLGFLVGAYIILKNKMK